MKKVARVYLRVSTAEQDLARQETVVETAKVQGYYIANVYREKASGAQADRPELLRLISDLQPGEVLIAEKLDRISRLPLGEAEQLIAAIRAKGARLAIPGVVDLSDLAGASDGISRIVLEAVQEMLLKIALQAARDDYETRRERQSQGITLAKSAKRYQGKPKDEGARTRIRALDDGTRSTIEVARLAGCSLGLVKIVRRETRDAKPKEVAHGRI